VGHPQIQLRNPTAAIAWATRQTIVVDNKTGATSYSGLSNGPSQKVTLSQAGLAFEGGLTTSDRNLAGLLGAFGGGDLQASANELATRARGEALERSLRESNRQLILDGASSFLRAMVDVLGE
jgi:hypothetical protein